MIEQTFGTHYSQRIADTKSIPVAVKIVDTKEDELRGFVAIDCVCINQGHFNLKTFQLNRSTELSNTEKQNILLIDIATLTIHEYAHIRARQVGLCFSTYCNRSN